MSDMEELTCSSCYAHLGWISDNAPMGFVKCDSCKEKDDQENEIDDDDFY